jgi:hypothetical protein
MLADGQPLHVLEDESPSAKFVNETDKLSDQLISGIFEHPMTDERKALAWRSSENDIHRPPADACRFADGIAGQADDRLRDYGSFGKVEVMNCGMNRVDFDSGDDVESGLFEAQRHAASSGEQVDSYWSFIHSETRGYAS